jgi:S-adenosylmethionine-diacylglycerol 3-amino-3-carboxypropyl transferase
MNTNPVQFAVVREDPDIEATLIERFGVRRALCVASGGCSVLSLATQFPALRVTAFDVNLAQLRRVEAKCAALTGFRENRAYLNIGDDRPDGLNQSGNFEGLFRSLRRFVMEFVLSEAELEELFSGTAARRRVLASNLLTHPYWAAALELHFSDVLLTTMFGARATQNASRASYPAYFGQAFQRALLSDGAPDNYFFHHILLGRYLERAAAQPRYLACEGPVATPELIHGEIFAVPALRRFELVSLSNLLDWMSLEEAARLAAFVSDGVASGSMLVVRQLNNDTDLTPLFPRYVFDHALGGQLLREERSNFYRRVWVGRRR